jgi:hypothetical protein
VSNLLNNSRLGYPYINYAPVTIILDSKRNWLKDLKNQKKEGTWCNTVYKGKDEKGNKRYEMVIPTKKLDQNVIPENPALQPPIPGIALNQQQVNPASIDPSTIMTTLTAYIQNYLNAAFTKTPFYPQPWTSQQTEMLGNYIQQNPTAALNASQNAFNAAKSVQIPLEVQQQQKDFFQKINGDPHFKEQFLFSLADKYFDSKVNAGSKQPEYAKYMDSVANYTLSPITEKNIINRLDAITHHPAVLADMIGNYNNITKQQTNNNTASAKKLRVM